MSSDDSVRVGAAPVLHTQARCQSESSSQESDRGSNQDFGPYKWLLSFTNLMEVIFGAYNVACRPVRGSFSLFSSQKFYST